MTIITEKHGFTTYTIASTDGKTQLTCVPQKGGVIASIIMPFANQPRELLYQHEHFWDPETRSFPGAWPFIFPICARIERDRVAGNYLYDGHIYNLPIHGLSWWLPWQVVAHAADSLTLRFEDTAETLKHYPFKFRIELYYQLSDKKLTCIQRYTNTGTKPLPYAAGFHPYFLTPPPNAGKEQVLLTYYPKRRFCYNERLTDLIGEQELLPSPIAIADPRVNEQLVELGDNKTLTLTYPDGLTIAMCVEGMEDPNLFKYVQTYTQPQKPFICVEPWMSVPNALNTVAGMRWLQPGQSESGVMNLWISP